MTLRIWDEARMASNSLEMYLNGNYFVPYFEGEPDLWCTKPPLLLWLQVLFLKTLGIGELALRMPSALAAVFLVFLIFNWSLKDLESVFPGIIAILILVISEGFVGWHGVRTGDYDILLALSTTAYLFHFYQFIHSDESRSSKHINYFFLFIVIAVWVKGIAGLIFLPVPALLLLIRKREILRSRSFWLKVLLCIAGGLLYYGIREYLNPGYLQVVYENEIGGRMFDAVEGHKHPFWYYFFSFPSRFGWSIWLLAPALIYTLLKGSKSSKYLTSYLLICAGFYLLLMSISQTKLPWYDIPMYPLMALIIGIGLFHALTDLVFFIKKPIYKSIAVAVLIVALFAASYSAMTDRVFKPKEYSWDVNYYRLSYFLRDKVRNDEVLADHILVDTVYCAHNKFYMNWLNTKGSTIDFAHRMKYIQPGKTVIIHQANVDQYIQSRFEYDLLEEFHNVKIYRILRRKDF